MAALDSPTAGATGAKHVRREDIEALYQLALGRDPESEDAIQAKLVHDSTALAQDIFLSGEFEDRVVARILAGRDLDGPLFSSRPSKHLREWAAHFLPVSEPQRDAVRNADTHACLFFVLFRDPEFRRVVITDSAVPASDLVEALGRRIGRSVSLGTELALEEDPEVALVAASNLFDETFYREASGVEGDRLSLVRHYVGQGEAQGMAPSTSFDPALYRKLYMRSPGGNALAHRLSSAGGFRFTDPRAFAQALYEVGGSGLFDRRHYHLQGWHGDGEGLSALEHYLSRGASEGRDPNAAFDTGFYLDRYPDVRGSDLHPFIHYIRIGRAQRRPTSLQEAHDVSRVIAPAIDARFYLSQHSAPEGVQDAALDYVTRGVLEGIEPSPAFSAEYYLLRYPDILELSLEPLHHFLGHGRDEGRMGRPDFSSWLRPGRIRPDPRKPTLVVCNHDSNRTGAPLIGLRVGQALSARYNIIFLQLREGPLIEDFIRSSTLVIVGSPDPIDAEFLLRELRDVYDAQAVVVNSVEGASIVEGAAQAGLPCVSMIHEFAEYSLPIGKVARVAAAADRVIVPAPIILESALEDTQRVFGATANNVVVHLQGNLGRHPKDARSQDLSREEILSAVRAEPETAPAIILGAGYVQIRKGADLFVQAAAEFRRIYGENFRFIWFGSGFEPDTDYHYSLWVKDAIQRLGLERHVFFLPAQSSIDEALELCDVFFLSSRLDPFPNTVQEALAAGRAVVCFDRASGWPRFFQSGDIPGGRVVEFGDVAAAARALKALIESGEAERAESNRDFVRSRLDFSDYVKAIEQELEGARRSQAEIEADVGALEQLGTFDADFHEGRRVHPRFRRRALRGYVRRARKGLLQYNPRPGFSEGVFKAGAAAPQGPAEPALLTASRQVSNPGAAPSTHACVVLSPTLPELLVTPRAVLHIHLHYADLVGEFVSRLDDLDRGTALDLVVTVNKEAARGPVEHAFADYAHGKVEVRLVPNRGRDLGAFLTGLSDLLVGEEYELVGHVHGKKTVDVPGLMGERWRRYLIDTLLGSGERVTQVLNLFSDHRLGLVFPEDHHAVGWTKNFDQGERLAARFSPPLGMPAFPVYPLGCMFWARTAALRPVLDLRLDWRDYPGEPLPYDGSMLHALERLLPSICERAGYDWKTVFVPGASRQV